LNVLEVSDVIEKGYIQKYNEDTNILIHELSLIKRENDNVINIILNSVSEGVSLLFDNMITTNEYEIP
jgi:hypothetical protein